MKKLASIYNTLGFTLDTRAAQFHRELYTILDDKELWPDRIRHVHIGDYSGARCDWSKIYPIYQPGEGDINWLLTFDRLRASGYAGALTLESPAIHAKGADAVRLNTSLDYLRAGMENRLGEAPPDKAGLRHKGTVELESERLRLRRFVFDDYRPMFERWSGTEEAARFGQLLRHKTPAKAKFQVQPWITAYRRDSFYGWAIEEKAPGRLIGYVVEKEVSNRFKTIGLMFALEQPARHKGYMTEALDDLKPNEIYIATGAHNSALWGELLTACGKARGAVGAVLDGYTRDTPKVIEQNFPVFCTGTWAQDSSVRTYVFQWRCPIEIGQVTIHNGDIVFGDIDGVLIIPKEIAPEVLEKALEKASTEKTMRKAIENGMLVTEAFAKFGVL